MSTVQLQSVAPIIAMLQSQGMWLNDKIVNDILRLCGEGTLSIFLSGAIALFCVDGKSAIGLFLVMRSS